MPRRVHRIFDINSGGGPIIVPNQRSVFANNLFLSVNFSLVAPHFPCPIIPIHCVALTIIGSPNVFAENIPVSREIDPDTCGHIRIIGSPNVFVN